MVVLVVDIRERFLHGSVSLERLTFTHELERLDVKEGSSDFCPLKEKRDLGKGGFK